MFLPIGDSPNPPGTPWVNYALIAANVAVYLLLLPLSFQPPDLSDPTFLQYLETLARERHLSLWQVEQLARHVSEYDLVVFRHGFRPAAPSLSGVLSSMFLHGGLAHLLGNMLFLWIYGDNVEHRLGRPRYLLVYLGTGAAACLGDGLLRMGSDIPSVGASGAISGVLGLYFIWFPRNRVRMWIFLFPLFANVVELPARLVLGFYILFDNLLPMVLTAGGGGVSYGAHIGGFLAGGALAFGLDRLALARPEADVRRRPAGAFPSGAGVLAGSFRKALEEDHWDLAAEWYFSAPHSLTRAALSPWEKIRLGQELERHGRPRGALAAYQRALADHPAGPGRSAAHLGAARVLMGPLRNPTGAYQHLYAALEEDPTADESARARSLLAQLARLVRSVPRGLPR
ncbi:MAG: rhomboid family intramembrane serine protease [Acidobacteriota bacterium]